MTASVAETQMPWLSAWPVAPACDWTAYVNPVEKESELVALRNAVHRGAPYGDPVWQQQTAEKLGLQSSLRPPGRPRKKRNLTPLHSPVQLYWHDAARRRDHVHRHLDLERQDQRHLPALPGYRRPDRSNGHCDGAGDHQCPEPGCQRQRNRQ